MSLADDYDDPTDALVEECRRDHDDRPFDGCINCDVRAQERICGHCNATLEAGKWYDEPTSLPCDHDPLWLIDGFGRDVNPPTLSCMTLADVTSLACERILHLAGQR